MNYEKVNESTAQYVLRNLIHKIYSSLHYLSFALCTFRVVLSLVFYDS